ncbi:MAG: 2-hydroxy-3-oxopropionate reductase [Armatimonadota bacterium]|nr:2-hydroxy-3-oxopropionate reductase [Armatimonadota bacterium]MDR7426274.1 2-hydroxy-3-oxopropionate reductase [Armatimonadota bacterium]MDR7463316.1 2-hydroxy-3-oxopropionate reductase [Armatimonadota bacterium]MDR7468950.1 2-hydroxy-3-oxopropionate reductase [Armatimonadota bacterium]MDR7473995.1 2-hydroxy-3-oxopropionate reductase [Armatimonadota bacterium]
MKQTIGFIGLGIMGKPMSQNLLRAGYPLVVHDVVRAPVEELVRAGAADGGSCRGVAERSDVVITMLPDSPDVRTAALGPDGILEGIRPGTVYVDMSTISPITTREVAAAMQAKGVPMLDAPVSGGQKGAIEATLSIMVGGPEEVFQQVRPIFEVMGKNIVHMGEIGAGQVTKACNQIVVGITIMAVSEALTLARKSGVDPARVRAALLGGFAQSRILELHGQRILERNFDPGFRIRLHHKDLKIALETGRATGTPLLATALVHEVLGALQSLGEGERDHSAIVRFVERLAGLDGAGGGR